MTLIRPFTGLRPAHGRAADVVAPPYDVVSFDEASARAQGRPFSFLHISRPEIDLPPGTDPCSPTVYARGRENFHAQISAGVLKRDPVACYYFYRLVMGAHVQTGIVAVASVADYEAGRIRRHEYTRPDKEDDRVRQIDALNAQTGPVFLTYRHDDAVAAITRAVCALPPEVDVTADDGIRHSLWVVGDPSQVARLTALFDAMPRLYIADGHHRSAAAARVATTRRAQSGSATGGEPRSGEPCDEESWNYFLAVIFPDREMQILDYNRVIRDLNGLNGTTLLTRLKQDFSVEPLANAAKPDSKGEFTLYLQGRWYRMKVTPARIPVDDPVGRLDVSLLQNLVIGPVFGITDPRRDKRIDFIGGIRGLEGLAKRVDSGEMAVAFALHPTSLAELMAVADVGEVMPPKSTWFEPKLADGLVSHLLD